MVGLRLPSERHRIIIGAKGCRVIHRPVVIRNCAGWSFPKRLVKHQLRGQQIRRVINNEAEQDGDSYMSPVRHLLSILGITSASIYYYISYLLLAHCNSPRFGLSPLPLFSPHQPVEFITTIQFRWRFSLSIHYGSIRTPIPYRCPSLSAEPVEAIIEISNLCSESSVIVTLRDSRGKASNNGY